MNYVFNFRLVWAQKCIEITLVYFSCGLVTRSSWCCELFRLPPLQFQISHAFVVKTLDLELIVGYFRGLNHAAFMFAENFEKWVRYCHVKAVFQRNQTAIAQSGVWYSDLYWDYVLKCFETVDITRFFTWSGSHYTYIRHDFIFVLVLEPKVHEDLF